ncbi:hypothetical protein C4577_04435 [Candidatus Parcubacteria bacterium]|nr:MAG: hypothetical protein C4577_04435 [Candidatus Parcubacteria bacterium]
MRELTYLFYIDLAALQRWFTYYTISKILVFLSFALIFGLTFLILFVFTKTFFQNLASYSVYGFYTASYILKASILVISWLSFCSSLIANSNFLLSQKKEFEYIFMSPIKNISIVIWLFFKSVLMNILFITLLILPFYLAFIVNFRSFNPWEVIFRYLFASILLITFTSSIAGIVSIYIVKVIIWHKKSAFIVILLIFLSVSGLFIDIILPKNLQTFYKVEIKDFMILYNNLPLQKVPILINWLYELLVEKINMGVVKMIFVSLSFGFIAIFIQSKILSSTIRAIKSAPNENKRINNIYKGYFAFNSPLIAKDLLHLFRTTSEASYSVFLFLLTVFFSFFLTQIFAMQNVRYSNSSVLLVFFGAWFLFFTTTFLLRIVYPSVAREGSSSWIFFQLIPKNKILSSKIFSSLFFSIPFLGLLLILFLFTPLKQYGLIAFLVLSFSIFVLSVINILMSFIFPNFKDGKNSEKVSTSSVGILTLIFCAVFIVDICFFLSNLLSGQGNVLTTSILLLGITFVFLPLLFFSAKYCLQKYEF